MTSVVVVGAGIVGAACAFYAATAGADVTVIERAAVADGTTGAGEGNLLLSDKGAGPELTMAQHSLRLWAELADRFGAETFELEPKGGLVVAKTDRALAALRAFRSAWWPTADRPRPGRRPLSAGPQRRPLSAAFQRPRRTRAVAPRTGDRPADGDDPGPRGDR